MITIDKEAQQRKSSPLNIDAFRETYKTENGLFVFSSPALWTLDKNLFYLTNFRYGSTVSSLFFLFTYLLNGTPLE